MEFSNRKLISVILFMTIVMTAHAQIFKTDLGSLESIYGVERYNIIFEYAENLEIPKYSSEEAFLEMHARKKDKKESGTGETFKNHWFSNREKLFEPKFIQEFNFFNLKEKQVTVARNVSDAEYTMVVRTSLIDIGNSNFFFKKDARLEVTIQIYKSDAPNEILYATEMVDVHSRGASKDDYDRIMSAYAELGRGLSKHLSRKT
ncbi:hypothetical protein FEE95_03485 [Maribacter algarum]|uniref:Uncharacterized protein n=1 Tax=Maribacter algarum (ex Zhang et al. 2020) TaxID=2578118 RepID=A0A5S3PU30_9FLAO|nr:hypothetical protein [Maribacter algarum]TMM58506.1 hypothetical protein FEE95_03485 [Maribacter algarum]